MTALLSFPAFAFWRRWCARAPWVALLLCAVMGSQPAAALTPVALPPDESPMWLDAAGTPTPAAREALSLLAHAAEDGLDPDDYAATSLAQRSSALASAPPAEAAAWDHALTLAMLRFLRELHGGRVDPHALGFRVRRAPAATDLPQRLRDAAASGRLTALAQSLRPAFAEYGLLRGALARYRALADSPEVQQWPAWQPIRAVDPGSDLAQAPLLRARLVAFGDLPADAPPATTRYDDVLVNGVKHFQGRHGLEADGVLGRATQRALAVPPAERVRQLEWAMERLRWLAPLDSERFIAINIPMYRLWAVDRTASPPLTMNVVVGRALNTRTPVLHGAVSQVIFRPYWNVPRSILLKEILPKQQRQPGYLASEDLEIVQGGGDDARPVAATADNIELLREGRLRLRQRPGDKNSLGRVKFVFPNDADVYLHDTPARKLFERARRDFSHGCVRVEQPMLLAEWVLSREGGWTRERIDQTADGPPSQRVAIRQPIPVVLFYMTAMVMPDDGSVHFVEDVYGHDARLQRALAARRR